MRGNRSFTVRERRYAVFPQSAGELTIGPAAFEAMVIPNRGFSRVQRLRSDTITVDVRPAVGPPASHPGAVWLPARRLELTESWADTSNEFSLGVPRTRVLRIVADGLLETQLPQLDIGQADGIRQYPDQPELERQVTDQGLEATRIQRYAVIAQTVGEATIPPAEIPWWNVIDERWEIARVDGSVVPVLPGEETSVVNDQPGPVAQQPAQVLDAGAGPWPWIAAAFGGGWLLTAVAWWWTVARRSRAGSAGPVARDAGPAGRPPSQRSLVRQMRAACAVGDAARAQHLLLQWAGQEFPDAPPASLGALAEKTGGTLAEAVVDLETHLYGKAGASWHGERLAAALAAANGRKSARKHEDSDPLEPLYR
jgi:hypothetical protein